MTNDLHSPARQLIVLRIERADLQAGIDRLHARTPTDQLALLRLRKQRAAVCAQIERLQAALDPQEPA